MRKAMRLLMAGLAMTAIVSVGCSKDDGDDESKTSLLTKATWKYQSAEMGMAGGPYQDANAMIDACDKDNIITFKSNLTLTVDEGASKCSSADPQITNGTWAFADNETKITMVANGFPVNGGAIEKLDGNNLVVTETQSFNGIAIKYRLTFKH